MSAASSRASTTPGISRPMKSIDLDQLGRVSGGNKRLFGYDFAPGSDGAKAVENGRWWGSFFGEGGANLAETAVSTGYQRLWGGGTSKNLRPGAAGNPTPE